VGVRLSSSPSIVAWWALTSSATGPARRSRPPASLEALVRPAEDGLDPEHQLPGREGLRQVIVGPELEPLDPVLLLPLGGQHQNREGLGGRLLAEGPEDLVAGEPGSMRSRTTRSGISRPTAVRAWSPVEAVSTRKPSRVSW
jgi:hypothetical protein